MESTMKRRLILRRFVNTKSRTITLWKDAFRWHHNADSPSVIIRGSGWALVAPYSGHEDLLSVVHFGGFIQILAADQVRLSPTDVQVKAIVAHTKLMQQARITGLEYALMDELNQQNVS